ncbi:MAG: hypothetical protein Q7V58_07240 [Actinomycetota bacterium]|nr:hypothetical protein [Actinomycetota bacterium]
MGARMTPAEFVEEFEWTRCRHGGIVTVAAPIFGLRPDALARRLYRARQGGFAVEFHDDLKGWHRQSALVG